MGNFNLAIIKSIAFSPEERRTQWLNDLSINLNAFVLQWLIPTIDRKRRAAIEILLNWGRFSDLFLKGAVTKIKKAVDR